MSHICFLSQFPPPIHGLSKAVETLYNSRLKTKFHFSKIDIKNNKIILLSLLALLRDKSELVYFTLSQSRWGNLRDLLFLKLIEWQGKRCVAHIHGGYYRELVDKDMPIWQRHMNYNAVRQLAGGIVLGHSLHSIFEGMLPDYKIFVCPNCIDDTFIMPTINEKITNMRECGTLHILYLSNFIESKGYRKVLELAHIAKDKGDSSKFIFHFAGIFFDSDEETFFKEHCKGLDNIVFHGVVKGQVKNELLRQCHIFILLTNYQKEGQPISILEAMGNAMSVVTTDHAGIPEIASAENGFICNKTDINILEVYDYLLNCYSDRNTLTEICRRNYEITKNRYKEKQYIENMDIIFESVCQTK